MFAKLKKYFIKTDFVLLGLALTLSIIGIFAIYSAGYNPVTELANDFYKKQSTWLLLGFAAFFIVSYIDYSKFIRFTPYIYLFGLVLLLIVLILGHTNMGAQRWIGIGSLKVQPSEVFKIIWVFTLGWLFMDFNGQRMGLITIFKKMLILIPPFILVFLQPDLGTSLTYVAIWGLVVLILGVKMQVYITFLLAILIILPVGWVNLHDYQKNRVKVFLGIIEDERGLSWHSTQSKVAIGSGGISGKGFLGGTQAHLNFLPESHTDFVFAVINEEKGLIGGTVVIVLFLLLLFRIFSISMRATEPAGKIIAIAVGCYIFFQFVVNAGMTVGLVPVVGIPMPFVSYGGTSILSFFIMLGLLNSIHLRRYTLTD